MLRQGPHSLRLPTQVRRVRRRWLCQHRRGARTSPGLPLVLGGLGLASAAGLAFGARRIRRLRPLPQEPESEVVVEGGFAEAQPAHDLTRGLHGVGFDSVAALVSQLEHFLSDSGFTDSPTYRCWPCATGVPRRRSRFGVGWLSR